MSKDFDKSKNEKFTKKANQEKFNSVTLKTETENQNQEHNVVREGIGPINQKR